MLYAWMFLVAAIATEVAATVMLSESGQTGELRYYFLMWVIIALSYWLLSYALRRIQVGIAVAIWEGLGTSLLAVVSFLVLDEAVSLPKIVGIVTSVVGITLLHFGSDE